MKVDLKRGRWSPATVAAYTIAWADFEAYCKSAAEAPLPAKPKVIAAFLKERAATHATASLSTRLHAIVAVHGLYGHEVKVKGSVIRDTWAEIRRAKGTASTPKAALTAEQIKHIVRGMPADAYQDRAVVLLGFATLLRRSELVALDVEDLTIGKADMQVTIRRSKTDKAGKGEVVAVLRTGNEFCPVVALETWLRLAEIEGGPIFRSRNGRMVPRAIADIAKRWAKNAGFDPKTIGAHSFRRGGITTMFRNGAKLEDIMRQSRHKTVQIALGYVEAQHATQNPAISRLGL